MLLNYLYCIYHYLFIDLILFLFTICDQGKFLYTSWYFFLFTSEAIEVHGKF